ncbi:unnamed protein product [Tilletia laevis]|uniref:Retrotransposon gag domain-containing protein n=2 Tax=Tilletia TaxID=13289 RepID=A0A8T8SIK4_9BASI|nr:hypothetical protein CF336_g8395 [Tilletia laevis]KAE8240898.1 hypothetical protein A4X03_0g8268 [Tilletia caries]KAE8184392.1 hypothetical protein CF335_g8035 [Tilletia laevis]CAD6892727.1 unnamed protein product [Tilletia caries]CAD6929827.1 unnamed protein product [Tilletia laevis]
MQPQAPSAANHHPVLKPCLAMSSTPTPAPTTAQLQSEIQSLRAQLALAASANLDPAFRVKVSDPPEFNGRNRREAGSFLAHLKLKFAANAPSFASDASKIVYAASWLGGEAFEWFEPFLKSGSHLDMEWDDFERQFLRSQGETDLKKTLTHDLQTLVQTGSAASYSTRFFHLATQLGWNDEALRARYYDGLKENVKDALAYADREPHDIMSLAELATRLDNRLYERHARSRLALRTITTPGNHTGTNTFSSRPPGASPAPNRSGLTPMDLDASTPRHQPLTDAEKQRRRDLGLFSYCGAAGHYADGCPRKSNRERQQSARRPGQAAAVSSSLAPEPDQYREHDNAQSSQDEQQ